MKCKCCGYEFESSKATWTAPETIACDPGQGLDAGGNTTTYPATVECPACHAENETSCTTSEPLLSAEAEAELDAANAAAEMAEICALPPAQYAAAIAARKSRLMGRAK